MDRTQDAHLPERAHLLPGTTCNSRLASQHLTHPPTPLGGTCPHSHLPSEKPITWALGQRLAQGPILNPTAGSAWYGSSAPGRPEDLTGRIEV